MVQKFTPNPREKQSSPSQKKRRSHRRSSQSSVAQFPKTTPRPTSPHRRASRPTAVKSIKTQPAPSKKRRRKPVQSGGIKSLLQRLRKPSITIVEPSKNSKPSSRSRSRQAKALPVKKTSTSPTRLPKSQIKKRPVSPIMHGIRLIILGVGVGAIAGTVLSVMDYGSDLSVNNPTEAIEVQSPVQANLIPISSPSLGREIAELKTQIEALAAKQPQLTPEAFFIDLDSGDYLDIAGATSISAASTIKVPVLMAFFEALDAGEVSLDEILVMTEELRVGEAGTMQYQPLGTEFTALETVTKMIVISDNTATNMIIARLGGAEKLNQRFQAWGLQTTVINNFLPDLEGTNTVSPKDLVSLMAMVGKGELLSARSRDRVMEIMKQTKTKTLLPQGLGEGATIAHKTGDIGSVVGDVGLIDMPNGKRYVAAVMVQRPHNDPQAQELIRQISRLVYDYWATPPESELEEFITTPEAEAETNTSIVEN